MRNSMRINNLFSYILRYFTEKPWMNGDGKVIKVKKITSFNDIASFHRYMTIHYVFLKVCSKIYN